MQGPTDDPAFESPVTAEYLTTQRRRGLILLWIGILFLAWIALNIVWLSDTDSEELFSHALANDTSIYSGFVLPVLGPLVLLPLAARELRRVRRLHLALFTPWVAVPGLRPESGSIVISMRRYSFEPSMLRDLEGDRWVSFSDEHGAVASRPGGGAPYVFLRLMDGADR